MSVRRLNKHVCMDQIGLHSDALVGTVASHHEGSWIIFLAGKEPSDVDFACSPVACVGSPQLTHPGQNCM